MIEKSITFIYSDAVQKQVYEMISAEAEKRGYRTKITNDRFAKCEIGWYCDHVNFPQFSRFSVIMLHDITQQYGNWPDIWLREPWNKYDIGFLPSILWVENWKKCSGYYYANTKRGIYLAGWPKADRLVKYLDCRFIEDFKRKITIDPDKPTILYAPAWENDGKQDEFVKAMLPLDVNILIKQAPWPDTYPEQQKNIKEMYELHKNNQRVIQLDPTINILDAIMLSDILVSEESSTMCECVMMGKPAVSVCNWLIPDVTPSRLPESDFEYTVKTTKEELTECIGRILQSYEKYAEEAKIYSEKHFSNIGKCIPIMLDVLDAEIEGKNCAHQKLIRERKKVVPFGKQLYHFVEVGKREVYYNYCARNRFMAYMWKTARNAKRWMLRNRKTNFSFTSIGKMK